jgi:hypothetical protein
LDEGSFSGLTGGVKHPIELILNVTVYLGAHQALLWRQHIVLIGTAGTGGIKKAPFHISIIVNNIREIKVVSHWRINITFRLLITEPSMHFSKYA